MRHEVLGYTVVFTKTTRFFALHSKGAGGRAFFQRYRDAASFKRDLAAHGLPEMKVMKAKLTLETR